MSDPNNPAGRLYSLIEAARRIQPNHQTKRVVDAWAKVFDLGPDSAELQVKISRVFLLLEVASERVREIDPGRLQRHAQAIGQLRSILAPQRAHSPFADFRNQLENSAGMAALDSLSAVLEAHEPEGAIPPAKLKEFQQKVNELLEEVLSWEGGSDDFKLLLVTLLQRIQKAISDYRIEGPVALINARVYIAGIERLNDGWIQEQTAREGRAGGFWEKFTGVVGRLENVIRLVESGKKLAASAIKALPAARFFLES